MYRPSFSAGLLTSVESSFAWGDVGFFPTRRAGGKFYIVNSRDSTGRVCQRLILILARKLVLITTHTIDDAPVERDRACFGKCSAVGDMGAIESGGRRLFAQ